MLELEAADLEDLAAYIDGRLSGEKKEQVDERLLRSLHGDEPVSAGRAGSW